jgi:hypothetical protein
MDRIPHAELVRRWKRLKRGRLFQAATASGYPIFGWRCQGHGPPIYLSAGIHGDEPAGPMAVTRLLETSPAWFRRHSWVIFPCLNPWGYEHGVRRNARDLDLNRLWREKREPEIRAVRRTIHGMQFELAYLMHEDYDARGFYLYELAPQKDSHGGNLVRAVRKILPVDSRRVIEGRRVSAPGLICRDASYRLEGRKRWPEALYLIGRHAGHLFNMETPSTGFGLGVRIAAQIRGLRAALDVSR